MRPIFRSRTAIPVPVPPRPDRTHLHLDQIQAVAARHDCDHAACIAKRDQATAWMAGFLTDAGVDLDDPVQLHAALAGLTASARIVLALPFGSGAVLAQHVAALASRTPLVEERS